MADGQAPTSPASTATTQVPSVAASGRKFGLLLFSVDADDDTTRQQIDSKTTTWVGTLAESLIPAETDNWQRWLGETEWRAIEARQRMVLSVVDSVRPDVMDRENEALNTRLERLWRALQLAAPLRPFSGKAWILTGTVAADGRLKSPQGLNVLHIIFRPYYCERRAFWKNMPWRDGDDWIARWITADNSLADSAAFPKGLRVALGALQHALRSDTLETRILGFVRVAECILALPNVAAHGG